MTTLHEMAEQARQGGDMSPLFIPLKTEFYEGFLRGDKREEYRVHGPRWNEKTCRIGREAVLSLEESEALRRDMKRRGVTGFKDWVLHVLGRKRS